MTTLKYKLFTFAAVAVGLWLAASPAASAANQAGTSATSGAPTSAKPTPELERQRSETQRKADKSVDRDAVAAVDEAQAALKAIAAGRSRQAIAAIERATGKINILTARYPAAALIPVDVEVDIVDHAPQDRKAIHDLSSAAEKAVANGDYPAARTLLDQLASEIRLRTYNLPLATYPAAMQETARLLDQNKPQEAETVLRTALNTLVVVDQETPLPVLRAQAVVKQAQAEREKDPSAAQRLLANAKGDLERAKVLGYQRAAPEYASLAQSLSELDRQLNGKEDTSSAFTALKERIAAFLERMTKKSPNAQYAANRKS